MKPVALKLIKSFVGPYVKDVTDSCNPPKLDRLIAYSLGVDGISGIAYRGVDGGEYAITKRTTALFIVL